MATLLFAIVIGFLTCCMLLGILNLNIWIAVIVGIMTTVWMRMMLKSNTKLSNPKLQRRMSFISEAIARGPFPDDMNIPDFPISGVLFLECLPSKEDIVSVMKEMAKMERLSAIPVNGPNGWEFQPVDINVLEHLIENDIDGDAALNAYLESHIEVELSREKPLWEIHMLRNRGDGRNAVLVRISHCIGDGISLVRVFSHLMTDASGMSYQLPKFDRSSIHQHAFLVSLWLSLKAFMKVLLLPVSGHDSPVVFHNVEGYNRTSGLRLIRSPNFSLSSVKEISKASNATINDVITAALGGTLRRLMDAHHDPLMNSRSLKIRALLPFAFPWRSSERPLTNKWCFLSLALGKCISEPDPVKRICVIKTATDELKASPEAFIQYKVQEIAAKVLSATFSKQTCIDIMTQHSMVFTNVPGPRETVYLCGKPIQDVMMYVGNVVPQISILSYDGQCSLTFVVNKNLFSTSDADNLAVWFIEEIACLRAALKLD